MPAAFAAHAGTLRITRRIIQPFALWGADRHREERRQPDRLTPVVNRHDRRRLRDGLETGNAAGRSARGTQAAEEPMPAGNLLYWALVALVIAVIAAVLGFGGLAGAATDIARILFWIFLVIFLVVLVMNFMGRGRGPTV
jgi:uncharacterized membrane protein YtjA (UPF0391 family)